MRTDCKKLKNKIIRNNIQIDNYIDKLNNLIVNAVEEVTPMTKKIDNFKKIKSPIVQKLYKEKSKKSGTYTI